MHADYGLPPNYTIFGKLTGGEDVLDKIATAQTGAQDRPTQPVEDQERDDQRGVAPEQGPSPLAARAALRDER